MLSKVLVIRLLPNMVNAISAQSLHIIAFGLEDGMANQPNIASRLAKDVRFFPVDSSPKNWLFEPHKSISSIGRIIREEKPDVIHVNALKDLLLTFIAVLLFSSGKKRPAIVAMSHNPSTWKDPRKAWFATNLIKFMADGFISLSTTHKKQLLASGVPAHKVTVIPNPYEAEQFRLLHSHSDSSDMKKEEGCQIVYVANICRRKAQDVLLRAAPHVLEKFPDAKFYFVGKVLVGEEKYQERLCTLREKLRISASVHFTGGLGYERTLEMVARSNIVAFPSRSEMMPRAIVEAMLLGRPIVASAVDGILDLIEDKKTGILVKPGNSDELAFAIRELIEQPFFANLLGRNAQRHVSILCSPERVGKSFLDFYKNILDQKDLLSDKI